MGDNRRVRTVGAILLACLSTAVCPAHAQDGAVTNLTCQLTSCTGNACSGVSQTVGVSIDVGGARARGGSVSEWVSATVEPDLVTFSRSITDENGSDRQTFSVSRTTLAMTWRWSDTPACCPSATLGVVAEYQCQLLRAQF